MNESRFYDGSWVPSGAIGATPLAPHAPLPLKYPIPAAWEELESDRKYNAWQARQASRAVSARDFNRESSAPSLNFYR